MDEKATIRLIEKLQERVARLEAKPEDEFASVAAYDRGYLRATQHCLDDAVILLDIARRG